MLTFTGIGSAFNTALGNNSCYIREENKLFLIDCGSSTFKTLRQKNILDGVDEVDVFITHLHPDHVGSLGDLIFYMYYTVQPQFQPKINIITVEHLQIERLLYIMGVEQHLYQISRLSTGEGHIISSMKLRLRTVKVEHVSEIDTHGVVIHYKDEKIYYSADSINIPIVVMRQFILGKIHKIYQDVSGHPNSAVHMKYDKLLDVIPEDERDRVYCMHLDEYFDSQQALRHGFNIAQ